MVVSVVVTMVPIVGIIVIAIVVVLPCLVSFRLVLSCRALPYLVLLLLVCFVLFCFCFCFVSFFLVIAGVIVVVGSL